MKIFYFLACFLLLQQSFAQEATPKGSSSTVADEDPELKNLQWNRYVKGDYVVLSIDESQGRWLIDNIDLVSKWCTGRWGLKDIPLSKECRIFCVPSNHLLKKLFNIEDSKAEVRRNTDGSISINVIWLSLESFNKESVAPYLTHILLSQSSKPVWFVRGAEIINSPLVSIRSKLRTKDLSHSCESILSFTAEQYGFLSKDKKESFDTQSLLLCLMLRKELGQIKLLSFLDGFDSNSDIRKVYGYKDMADFESKYKMYCNDLLTKINTVPDFYFIVKGVD
jgi:hypothetical protein